MKFLLKICLYIVIGIAVLFAILLTFVLLDDGDAKEQPEKAAFVADSTKTLAVEKHEKSKPWTIKSIPNTRLRSNSIHVSDPDSIIGAAYCDSINRILSSVRDSADIFVVAVNQVENADGNEFTNELFNYWGIGDKDKDNGVLMFMTMTPHFLRIETGYGMEGILTDALCSRIERDAIKPLFLQDKYPEGILEGVKAMAAILGSRNIGVSRFAQIVAEEKAEAKRKAEQDQLDIEEGTHFLLIIGKILLFLHICFSLYLMKVHVADYRKAKKNSAIQAAKTENDKLHAETKALVEASDSAWFVYLLFPLVFIVYIPIRLIIRKKRRQTRHCPICGKPLRLLSEKEEDKYLKKNEQLEEKNGAIEYDVWYCEECDDVNVEQYRGALFDYYKKCKKCGAHQFHKAETTVVLEPTYYECGEKETVFRCEHCGHEERTRTSIPKKEHSSKGSGWFRSSSDDNDRYDSGSSGSGSFGGGSSGGGGASTSW